MHIGGWAMKVAASLLGLSLLLVGCAQSPYQLGTYIPGRIVSLSDGKILPMQIELSYGSGHMKAVNPDTGETFDGIYTAINETKLSAVSRPGLFGDQDVASQTTVSDVSQSSAVLVGSKGTVIDVKMTIKSGAPPIGYGDGVDNAGKKYRVQF
jgi:hypothetical protein